MNSREAEIQKHLAMLYDQQKAFSSPTPADDPAEYEVEGLEAWKKGTRMEERGECRESSINSKRGKQLDCPCATLAGGR